jgi:mannose-6-phosphate isomerase-like protein (cupin superfamily)
MNSDSSHSSSAQPPAPGRIEVIPTSALETGNFSVELEGKNHANPGISLILVDAAPGRGPSLHVHAYAEVMIVQEGTGTFTDGVSAHEVTAGHVVIVPAGRPHAFTNTGDGPLRQIDIHVADAFATDWL